MNQHTAQDIKGNRQPHTRQRALRAMNNHLEDARLAKTGDFSDCPKLAEHYINCYIIFLQEFHVNGEEGSLLD